MPFLKTKFQSFEEFADADLVDLYGAEDLADALTFEADIFESIILRNHDGKLIIEKLPLEAQASPMNSCIVRDLNEDGKPDLITGGNRYGSEVETTRADMGIGTVLLQGDNNDFRSIPANQSGFYIPHDVRHLNLLKTREGGEMIVVANNNFKVQFFEIKKQ